MQRGDSAGQYFERLLVEAGPFENNDMGTLLKMFLQGLEPRWSQSHTLYVTRLCTMLERPTGPNEDDVVQLLVEADASVAEAVHAGCARRVILGRARKWWESTERVGRQAGVRRPRRQRKEEGRHQVAGEHLPQREDLQFQPRLRASRCAAFAVVATMWLSSAPFPTTSASIANSQAM